MFRQTEKGKMRKAPPVPAGFFEKRSENFTDSRDKLAEQSWTKGLRDIELRSNDIITVHVDQIAKISGLKKKESFIVFSTDDARFAKGVNPIEVYRFSRGARARKIDAGEFKTYIDHWLHLKLPYRLKKNLTYTIKLTNKIIPSKYENLKTEAQFKLNDLYNPSFKLNQVGYSKTAGNKFVYLSSYLGDGPPVNLDKFKTFKIIDLKTKKIVFDGKIEKVSECDIQGKDKLSLLNISKFDKSGKFQVEVDGLGRSYPFLNGDRAAEKMYEICHRGLYFQRSGQEIKEPYAEGWSRPMAHNKIYVTKENLTSPIPFGKVNPTKKGKWFAKPYEIHGGHYDAGDYDLRPMHINLPEKLLTLYEAFPEKFYDGQVNIHENKNGIPDIIDEAAWNLLSLEYIQDYAMEIRGLDGGVAPGMETYTHPGPTQAMDKDPLPYYMRKVTGPFTLCASAEFAHIARIIEPFDAKRAAKYLKRAKQAYKYGYKYANEPLPKNLDQGQGWDKNGVKLAKIWASTELYCTTGEKKYWDEIIKYKDLKTAYIAGTINSGQARFSLLLSKRKHPDPEYVGNLRKKYLSVSNKLNFVKKNAENGYAASTPSSGGWGATSCVVLNIEAVTRAYMLSKNPELLNPIATSIDFTLGMNPSEISWMTGAGTKFPMDPLNLNCLDDGIEKPHPGILWYGPTNYWYDAKVVLYPDKSKMGFYRRITDNWTMVAQCEYTVWETQVPFIFAAGCLLPDKWD
ncbi:MAG: glycoside hydrolase family 9 protein [Verrucomicrobiota bacterium]|nr:glycoside hydrolase family 9 protein [Verrucomicrobiota bacterium]